MTRNGNKIKDINFFISTKCVYFFYNVDCLLKKGALALLIFYLFKLLANKFTRFKLIDKKTKRDF